MKLERLIDLLFGAEGSNGKIYEALNSQHHRM